MVGRHAADSSAGFYKDLAMMILGILLVGASVFLFLYVFFGRDSVPATTSTSSSTTIADLPSTTTTTGVTTSTAPISSTTTTTAVPVRPANEVRVVVLNSMGLAGAAGLLTADLAEAGYQTLQAADFEPEQDPSRIWYREGFSAEANTLLEFLPDAVVEEIPDPSLQLGADVVLVLGTGYEG
jgi:hypothetical protein